MLWIFFDTSAIIKRFHKEKGTEAVDRIVSSILEGKHRGIISSLIILEFVSALRRKVSSEEISWREFIDTVMSFLKESTENFSLEAVESNAYGDAVDFVIRYALLAPDSIHLASISRTTRTLEKSKFILVSADKRLCESAEREGFRILNPEEVTSNRIDEILRE